MDEPDTDIDVPLRVLWPHEFDRTDQWAVGGVPLDRGELDPDDEVALRNDEGGNLPLQTRELAYWPDGSVKWLLVVTRCDVVSDETRESKDGSDGGAALRLVRGHAPGMRRTRVRVEDDEDVVRVHTGSMTFTVPRTESVLLGSVELDGRELLRDDDRPELFVDVAERANGDDGSTTRYSDRSAEAFRSVEVEEDGPCRAIVKVTGTHVAADGSTFGPYTVRLYAHAGETSIRLSHTFVYDGYPDSDLIESLGVRVPTAIETPRQFAYGGADRPVSRSYADRSEWDVLWKEADLYQETADSYRFDKRIEPDRPPVEMESGDRADGWVDLATDDAGLAVGIRDAWQNAPKALRMNPEERSVTAYLWPDRGDSLDLQRYSDSAYGKIYECPAEAEDMTTAAMPTMNAHGISKTHDVLLHFHDGGVDDADLADRFAAFDDPPRVTAPLDRYAETEVFGKYAADAPPGYEEQAAWIEEGFEYIEQEREYRGWYGMIDYGDVVRAYDRETHQWTNDEGGHGWLNTEFQPDQWLWYCFLVTGRYDAFQFAEAMTKHTSDVDVLQAGPWWGIGSRHGVQHWSDGDREIRVSMPGARRIHYYLTGDERTRDVIELALSRYQTMQREEGRTWLGFDEELYARTDVASALFAYYVAWEMTGSDHYETLVRNIVENHFCDLHPKGVPYNRARMDLSTGEGEPIREEALSSNMFLQFGGLQIVTELADTGDFPDLYDAVLEYAHYQLLPYSERRETGDNAGRGLGQRVRLMHLTAFAYRETGEEKFRRAMEEALSRREVYFEPASWNEDLLVCANDYGSPPCALAAYGRKAPYAFHALDDGPENDSPDGGE